MIIIAHNFLNEGFSRNEKIGVWRKKSIVDLISLPTFAQRLQVT